MSDEIKLNRRAEYAELTRQAIEKAALELFRRRGFFTTKVDDIASLARVSPATVYAVSGGKQGLLKTLIETFSTDAVVDKTLGAIRQSCDGNEIISLVARSCRVMREQHDDIIKVMLNISLSDNAAAEYRDAATKKYRAAISAVADRLEEIGSLRSGITKTDAEDILWFYFGYSGLFVLHDENSWSYKRAEIWLRNQAHGALIKDDA